MSRSKKPKKPNDDGKAVDATQKCMNSEPENQQKEPEEKFSLVELVEFINSKMDKWVKGAADETNEKPDSVSRTTKDNKFLQYINLKKNDDNPEEGRYIYFSARVKSVGAKDAVPKNLRVEFSYNKVDGPNKDNQDIWNDKNLIGEEKEGFGSPNGQQTIEAYTDEKGWTRPVVFYLSQYGGDEFTISAKLHQEIPTSDDPNKPKTTKNYIVWRKFWYQLTYWEKRMVGQLKKAEKAFENVFIQLIMLPEKAYKKDDIVSAENRKRIFYPKYMFEVNGGDGEVVVIGGDTKDIFTNLPFFIKAKPKEPKLKANIIVCDYQCDPGFGIEDDNGQKKLISTSGKITKNGQMIDLPVGIKGNIICKPGLNSKHDLLKGNWKGSYLDNDKKEIEVSGNFGGEAIDIDPKRESTLSIKIDLSKSKDPPPFEPNQMKPIQFEIEYYQTAEMFAGEYFGEAQVLAELPQYGNAETSLNNTIAHEFGHGCFQTPELGAQTKPVSLKNHPLQYQGHGGSGSHCRHDAKSYLIQKPVILPKIKNNSSGKSNKHDVLNKGLLKKGYDVFIVDENNSEVENCKIIRIKGETISFSKKFVGKTGYEILVKDNPDDYWWHIEYEESNSVDSETASKWNDSTREYPRPVDGDCLMFHQSTSKCSGEFCEKCSTFLQLQEIENLSIS